MRYLWAPWRSVYLKQLDKKACFLCQALHKKQDRRHLVIARTKTALAIMNRYPYNTGHLLIASCRHKGNLEDFTTEEVQGLFNLLKEMKKLLSRVLKPQGFNIGINLGRIAGAGLQGHLHIHLVPRWSGDTNFMPILSQTKVISQELHHLYDQLRKAYMIR